MIQQADQLIDAVRRIGPMVVAFSGGVDSTLVAAAAARSLPADSVVLVTADSDSLAGGEREHCRDLAAELGLEWTTVTTNEFADSRYVENAGDRCFWCKSALMDQLEPIARARAATIVLGVNIDDLGDHRPGQKAARERGAAFPLVDAGFAKSDVRATAKQWGLPVWNRPAMPCLASRVPYGTAISVSLLSQVDRAEAALRDFGFRDVRVRHYDSTARIEVPADEMALAVANAEAITARLREVGYEYVTLDLGGLRSGNLNTALS